MNPDHVHPAGIVVLRTPGPALFSQDAVRFKTETDSLLTKQVKLVVDLSAVTFLDSAACAALLTLHRRVREMDGVMRICGVGPSVRALFEQLRIQRVLHVHPTIEDAVAAMQG